MELEAEICPYVKGSSTFGGKKSTVNTRQVLSLKRYTAASSFVDASTSIFGLLFPKLNKLKISPKSSKENLEPQPPDFVYFVNLNSL